MTAPMSWNPQQAEAMDAVGHWLQDPSQQVFRLFGYAGTGKTTLAMHLAESAHQPIFAAYTGKAAHVLQSKGCYGARTLHSLLYNVRDRDKTKLRELKDQLAAMDPRDQAYPELKAEHNLELDKVRRPWFHVNPDSDLRFADLLVVDEVSMVDARIGKDIESFGKKVLVLGDPAQLPPVKGGGYFTNAKPDILLTEIHRQAADNPILRWATMARKGEPIPHGDLGLARKMPRGMVDDSWLATSGGQVLVGKNDTRRDLNRRIRAHFGHTSEFPVHGDVLVALMNDYKLGVLNGTLCKAIGNASFSDGYVWVNLVVDRERLQDVKVDPGPFQGTDPIHTERVMQLDYGYALTVHKAQGSQWDAVTLYDDGFGKRDPEVRRRWLYTAITRAATQLTILTS